MSSIDTCFIVSSCELNISDKPYKARPPTVNFTATFTVVSAILRVTIVIQVGWGNGGIYLYGFRYYFIVIEKANNYALKRFIFHARFYLIFVLLSCVKIVIFGIVNLVACCRTVVLSIRALPVFKMAQERTPGEFCKILRMFLCDDQFSEVKALLEKVILL